MVSDLEQQNAQTKELLNTLEKIKAIVETIKATLDEFPSEDELNDLAKAASNLATLFGSAREDWENMPSEDELNDRAKAAANVASSLRDTEE